MGPKLPLATALNHRARALLCLLLAGMWLAPAPAAAQETGSSVASTVLLENLSIVKAEDMDFGNIAIASGAGTVVLAPTVTPTCTVTGGIIQSGECQPAVFFGSGRLNRLVRVRVPAGARMDVTNPTGATMRIDDMTVNGTPDSLVIRQNVRTYRLLVLNLSGIFQFRVGGTLRVGAAQAQGTYTGNFEVDVQYF